MFRQNDNSFNDIRDKSLNQWLNEMEQNDDIAVRGGVKLNREYIQYLKAEIDRLKQENELKNTYLKKIVKNKKNKASEDIGLSELVHIVEKLRANDGCPWDREQTHESLKGTCIEEAAEIIGGINILTETGKSDNLKEELGDLLFQVILHAQIAREEGLFDVNDVIKVICEKMIRRHPHVFGEEKTQDRDEIARQWSEIKKQEKAGREWEAEYLPKAFSESEEYIREAKIRKGI